MWYLVPSARRHQKLPPQMIFFDSVAEQIHKAQCGVQALPIGFINLHI